MTRKTMKQRLRRIVTRKKAARAAKPRSRKELRKVAAAVDQRWRPPLDRAEHTAVARHRQGGSVRRLRRIVDAILRERDVRATRN
jgi:hypothetical protein